MSIYKGPLVILISTVVVLAGCSGGISPVSPESQPSFGSTTTIAQSSHSPLGFFTFLCDPVNGTVDVIALRDAELHINALKFLEPPVLVYLTLESPPQFNGNILNVDIGLTNPYLGMDQFTGFDVCGIVFTHGSLTGFSDPDIVMTGEGDTRLLNADGYTRWWNPAEFPHGNTIFDYTEGMLGTPSSSGDFNCTINGYKYFADDLGPDDPLTSMDISNRGMFSAGQKNVRHYTIDLSGGLIFNYAVDACWKKPATIPPETIPDDFPPGANRPEAWNVSVTELENSLYYDEEYAAKGGKLSLLIDVWDHYNANLNKVFVESLAGLPLTGCLTPIGGDDGYSTYQIDFTGEKLTQNGETPLCIVVQSEAVGYDGLLPGEPVCAYYLQEITVRTKPDGWARSWGGTSDYPYGDYALGVIVDNEYNSYVTGSFEGTADFNPGEETEEHISLGSSDIFLCKYDPYGDLLWARTWGGVKWDGGFGIALDGQNNILVTGGFWSPVVDFDPGPGIDEHASGAYYDIFVSKFDSNGNFIWARTWGGPSPLRADFGNDIDVDSAGNIYVTGEFCLNVDFDPGPGTDYHDTSDMYDSDIFLSKFDPDGQFLWAKTWGGNQFHWEESGEGVCIDNTGDVYVTGRFLGIADFDPGPGVDEHTSNGNEDVFISKFNQDGEFLWTRTWGGSLDDIGSDLTVDGSDNVYVTGKFFGTVDFNPGPGIDEHDSIGPYDAYFTKFDSSGNHQWTHTWGGSGSSDSGHSNAGFSIAIDGGNLIYVTGCFIGEPDFDPGPGETKYCSNGDVDVFLCKYNSEGDLISAFTFGAAGLDLGLGVSVSISGSPYITGSFEDTVDFDPGPGIYPRTSNGGTEAFLSKFPPDGNW